MPLAFVVVAVIFRSPLTAMINKAKKIGYGNKAIELSEIPVLEQQQRQADRSAEAIEAPAASQAGVMPPPSAAVAALEKIILARRDEMNEAEPLQTNRLIRALAIVALHHEFEVINRLIFGSQIALILQLNAGISDRDAAQAVYTQAEQQFPEVHKGGNFENWLAFLLRRELIAEDQASGNLSITPKGQEYLQYLVSAGLTLPKSNG